MAATMQQLVEYNLQQRQMLLRTSPIYNKDLGTNTQGTLGGTSRIKLQNVGFTKRLIIEVTASVDIGTATAVLSGKGPFNLINRVRLQDYAGNDRVNCSGAALFAVNAARYRTYFGYNNEAATAVFTSPTVPTAVGAAQTLRFFLEIPLTYSDTDLRGLVNTQTAVGEMNLILDWNSTLVSNGNDDAVYAGAATSTVILTAGTTISVQTVQEYFAPQANADGTLYAPQLDMMTAYAIEGGIRSSDNIAANVEKFYNLPNLRSVTGLYYAVRVNSLMDNTTPTKHRLLVNGNNAMIERPNRFQLMEQRRYLNSDLRPGQYFMIFRDRPVETSLLGNCQLGLTFGAVSGTSDVEYTVESYYPLNGTLPGLTQ